MQAKKVLLDISEPRRLCLQELGLRRLFVKWVKDALEGTCRHYRLCFHSQVIFFFFKNYLPESLSTCFLLVSVPHEGSMKNGVFAFRHQ